MVTFVMHLCIICAVLKLYFWKLYWLRIYIYIYILTVTIHWVDSNNVSKMNSLWPGDVIWRHVTRSTLDQVMACCLTAPSHYLNQCWLTIGEAPWHSSQDIILIRCEDTNQQNKIENCNFKWHPGHNELMINEIVRQRFIAVTSISKKEKKTTLDYLAVCYYVLWCMELMENIFRHFQHSPRRELAPLTCHALQEIPGAGAQGAGLSHFVSVVMSSTNAGSLQICCRDV